DEIARPEPRETTAGRALRRGVEDRRAVGCPRLAAVTDRRQALDAALEQMVRRLHVDHFGRTRPALGAGAADDEDGIFVDAERRIVDAPMVVFRAVEDHAFAFEYALTTGLFEISLAEIIRYDAHFHDRAIEEIACQHEETGAFHHRRRI